MEQLDVHAVAIRNKSGVTKTARKRGTKPRKRARPDNQKNEVDEERDGMGKFFTLLFGPQVDFMRLMEAQVAEKSRHARMKQKSLQAIQTEEQVLSLQEEEEMTKTTTKTKRI